MRGGCDISAAGTAHTAGLLYTVTDGYRRGGLRLMGNGWTTEARRGGTSANRGRTHSDEMTDTPRDRHQAATHNRPQDESNDDIGL
jgi:hypothetical protein